MSKNSLQAVSTPQIASVHTSTQSPSAFAALNTVEFIEDELEKLEALADALWARMEPYKDTDAYTCRLAELILERLQDAAPRQVIRGWLIGDELPD